MEANDYSEFKQVPNAGEAFVKLNELVEQAKNEEALLVSLATKLKEAQERLRLVLEQHLPEQMASMGLEEFVATGGLKITLKNELWAGIKDDNKFAAHKWLDENGHAGLLKRDVTVSFNKGQEEQARQLLQDLTGKFASVAEKHAVHPSTLKAWVKEMLEGGKEFPLHLFGVQQNKVAKITVKK